jgi:hypothetical protein
LSHVINTAVDVQQDIQAMEQRLEEEASIASGYGTGSWAFFRGAMFEFSRKGMWNRVFLIFCAFTLANLSGASGKPGIRTALKILANVPLRLKQSIIIPQRSLALSELPTSTYIREFMD